MLCDNVEVVVVVGMVGRMTVSRRKDRGKGQGRVLW